MELFLGSVEEKKHEGVEKYDVIIVGAGPAGLTAGIYAKRSGLTVVILDKKPAGGLASEAPLVENYPGFKSIPGGELAKLLEEHAREYVEVREMEGVRDLKIEDGAFRVTTEKGEYEGKGVILATGTTHRVLGIKGEKEFYGRGLSYCVTCDGYLFKGGKVAVIGGGNSGAAAALFLKSIGAEPLVIEFMDRYMCEDAYVKKLEEEGIPYLMYRETTEIFGDEKVKGIRVKKRDGSGEETYEVDGVFIYVGLVPQSELARNIGVELTEKGYVKTDGFQRTNVERFFAAGDITGGVAQIVVAAAQGAIAALSAYEDIKLKG